MNSELPAVLGGSPAFDSVLALVKPALPKPAGLQPAVERMLASGMLTKGKHLVEFETALAEHLHVRHAVAVSSCTTGLMLAYRAMELTGEVIVPSFTFMATVGALAWLRVRPVFVDVRRDTVVLDPEAVERAITPRTTAIVAVHTFGNPADMDALQRIADRRGLRLIYDAAHGFGTLYRGRPVGAQGDAQVFSMSPTKLLIAGEGGVVATNDDQLAEQIRIGREYGNDGSYDTVLLGMNARMGEFNALLGLQSLRMLEDAARERNRLAAAYRRHLDLLPGIELQRVEVGDRCSYKDFSIVIHSREFGLDRDQTADALRAERIDTRKYYYPAVHRHAVYRELNADDALLPNTNFLADNSLSLPMGAHLTEESVARVCAALERLHRHAAAIRKQGRAAPLFDGAVTTAFTARVAP